MQARQPSPMQWWAFVLCYFIFTNVGQKFSTCDINPDGARATPQLDLWPQVGRVPAKKVSPPITWTTPCTRLINRHTTMEPHQPLMILLLKWCISPILLQTLLTIPCSLLGWSTHLGNATTSWPVALGGQAALLSNSIAHQRWGFSCVFYEAHYLDLIQGAARPLAAPLNESSRHTPKQLSQGRADVVNTLFPSDEEDIKYKPR